MAIRLAINGYGRIGRNVLRALYESKQDHDLHIVAINDLGEADINAYLTRYDSVHGPFNGTISTEGKRMTVNGHSIQICAEKDPAKLPWRELEIDIVLECTGRFITKDSASAHLQAGAKKVLISAPGGKDVDATIVYGVNHHTLSHQHTVVSNASCTTNCLAPLVKPLHEAIGIESGLMTTIHAYTNDQVLTDVYHTDQRRARSATQSMIPTKTGAAAAVGLVLPELAGKLDGFAVRVPTINVSLVDLTFIAKVATSVKEINDCLHAAAQHTMNGVLQYCDEPLVSIDFKHNPASSIYDATQTRVDQDGRLVKVLAWYDNEWGFSNRMLDTARVIAGIGDQRSGIRSGNHADA